MASSGIASSYPQRTVPEAWQSQDAKTPKKQGGAIAKRARGQGKSNRRTKFKKRKTSKIKK
jgi:hypothetical protein